MKKFAWLVAIITTGLLAPAAAFTLPHRATIDSALGGPLLYTSGGGSVNIYELADGTNRLIDSLRGFSSADSVAVDRAHNVYVADAGAQKIYVYHRNSFFPFRTLDDPAGQPNEIILGPDGSLYAANSYQSYLGTVVYYPPGATSPTETLTVQSYYELFMDGIALNSRGTVFVRYKILDYSYYGTEYLVKFARGSSQPKPVPIGLLPESNGSGILFDPHGRLLVSDPVIAVFDLPHRLFKRYFGAGVQMALDRSGKRLFSADPSTGNIYEYDYPSGKLVSTIANAPAQGIALDPPMPQ